MSTLGLIKQQLTELKFHQSVMGLRQMRKSLIDLYPSLQLRFDKQKREAMASELAGAKDVSEAIAFTQKHMGAGSCQITSEIEGALTLINARMPKVLCEIGTFDGGTSLLFSRFVPSLETMVCIDLYVKNKEYLRLLAPQGLSQRFFDMPSYNEESVEKVIQHLDGKKIDVLFIDGDHRYEGVKKDFLHYRHLVREGGLIFLHDIMASKDGGRAWAGGVPVFWQELAALYPHQEFVDNREQQGFGIGAITYSATVALPVGFEKSL